MDALGIINIRAGEKIIFIIDAEIGIAIDVFEGQCVVNSLRRRQRGDQGEQHEEQRFLRHCSFC